MSFIVATNVVVSQPPKRQPTGMLTAHAKSGQTVPNGAKQGQTWPNGAKLGQTGTSWANWGDHSLVGVRAESILGLAGDPPRDGS